MRYLVHTRDELGESIGVRLSEEIRRFDIRAEIEHFKQKDDTIRELKNGRFDLFVEIGSKVERRYTNAAKKAGAKRCFVMQSATNTSRNPNFRDVDLVVTDFPGVDRDKCYFGNPIMDVVKSCTPVHFSAKEDHLQVAVLVEPNTSGALQNALSGLNLDHVQLRQIDLAHNLESALPVILESNAAIVTGNIGELVCLQLNCPAIKVNRHGLFIKDKSSLTNELLQREAIQVLGQTKPQLITDSILKILNDHNYCAGVLQDFQEAKDVLGTQPAIRDMARYLVDWLEES